MKSSGFPGGLGVDHQEKTGVKDFEDQATRRTEVGFEEKTSKLGHVHFELSIDIQERF